MHELINFPILASPTSIGPAFPVALCGDLHVVWVSVAPLFKSMFYSLLLGSEGGALALLLSLGLPVSVQTHLLEEEEEDGHTKTIDLSGQHTVGRKELGGGGGGGGRGSVM